MRIFTGVPRGAGRRRQIHNVIPAGLENGFEKNLGF